MTDIFIGNFFPLNMCTRVLKEVSDFVFGLVRIRCDANFYLAWIQPLHLLRKLVLPTHRIFEFHWQVQHNLAFSLFSDIFCSVYCMVFPSISLLVKMLLENKSDIQRIHYMYVLHNLHLSTLVFNVGSSY